MQLVMPACLGGELWNILNEFGAMSESEARFYMACLTLALQRLHKLGIVYRDLKPENVLVGLDGHAKLADFGSSKLLTGRISATIPPPPEVHSLCGTPEYMAPEVVKHKYGYGTGKGEDRAAAPSFERGRERRAPRKR